MAAALSQANSPRLTLRMWMPVEQGVRGLYQGLRVSMANAVVTTGLGFTSYEMGVDAFSNFNNGRSPTPGQLHTY